MRSRASIGGHPIHPMLIAFPLAFLTGGFISDLAGNLGKRPLFWSTGYYLVIAGVVTAILAAVPGFIDYFFTVPPKSSARARATKHMLIQLSVVAMFLVAWAIRDGASTAPGLVSLVLEGVATGFLMVGAWHGGTLAFRNAIGVDHRYAEAGQWNEASYKDPHGEPLLVASADELKVNQMKLLHVAGRRVVLGRADSGYVAFDDSCTHRGGSLAGGVMICGTVHCPWHGSQFDTGTGKPSAGPATKAIKTYKVEERGGDIYLLLRGK
ncbi:MAG: DUF2231 domain-containing protein [Gemmatimonadota bacterium]